jgi:hypothetical protein
LQDRFETCLERREHDDLVIELVRFCVKERAGGCREERGRWLDATSLSVIVYKATPYRLLQPTIKLPACDTAPKPD